MFLFTAPIASQARPAGEIGRENTETGRERRGGGRERQRKTDRLTRKQTGRGVAGGLCCCSSLPLAGGSIRFGTRAYREIRLVCSLLAAACCLPTQHPQEGGGLFTLGKSLFLDHSGCRGDHCSALEYPGSNGLMLVGGWVPLFSRVRFVYVCERRARGNANHVGDAFTCRCTATRGHR